MNEIGGKAKDLATQNSEFCPNATKGLFTALRPYNALKPSGVSWLGEIPDHWELLPALAVYKPRHVKNIGMKETTVLSLSYGRIVVKPPEKLHGLVPESFETYQIVDPGNIIVRTTDLQNDQTSLRIGYSRNRGIITSAYMCLETTARVSSEFGYQFLNTYDLLKIIYGFGSGLRQNLDFGDIKRMPVLVPSGPEQTAIVHFLRHADRRIRTYILAKQKLIMLLEEQKKEVVNALVSKGVNTSVQTKSSGVQWLTELPAHWEVTRLKFIASRIVDCLHATPVYSDNGKYPAIRTADVQPGVLLLDSARRVDEETYQRWTSRMAPMEGDILYTREGERFGIAAVVPRNVRLCISQRMMAFRLREAINPEFVMWQLNCRSVYAQAAADQIGSAAPHVNVFRIKNLWLAMPPRQEQDVIVNAIQSAIDPLHSLIRRAVNEITLLREYRTRLIADVVTGKLDVREAAAQFPDDSTAVDAIDTTEAVESDEVSAEDITPEEAEA